MKSRCHLVTFLLIYGLTYRAGHAYRTYFKSSLASLPSKYLPPSWLQRGQQRNARPYQYLPPTTQRPYGYNPGYPQGQSSYQSLSSSAYEPAYQPQSNPAYQPAYQSQSSSAYQPQSQRGYKPPTQSAGQGRYAAPTIYRQSYQQPTQTQQGNTYQQPQQGNTYQQPQQANTYQQPQQANTYQQPQQSNTYQQPQQANTYQQPQQGNTYQQPMKWNTHQSQQAYRPEVAQPSGGYVDRQRVPQRQTYPKPVATTTTTTTTRKPVTYRNRPKYIVPTTTAIPTPGGEVEGVTGGAGGAAGVTGQPGFDFYATMPVTQTPEVEVENGNGNGNGNGGGGGGAAVAGPAPPYQQNPQNHFWNPFFSMAAYSYFTK
ncbi:uncharacterized protein [Haliotis asinina]